MTRKTLNGTWSMYRLPEGEKTDLTVPGSVISGLMAAGKLEDPRIPEKQLPLRSKKKGIFPDASRYEGVTGKPYRKGRREGRLHGLRPRNWSRMRHFPAARK